VIVWRKISGGCSSDPLIWTWRSEPSKSRLESSAYTIKVDLAGDGIHTTFGSISEYTATFDNHEHPLSGQTVAAGTTVTLKCINDRSFEQITKRNGRETIIRRYVLSQDGRTLTQTNLNPNGEETAVFVFDKQS
jgi:hypothetical protein